MFLLERWKRQPQRVYVWRYLRTWANKKRIKEGGLDGGVPKEMEDNVDVYDLVPSGAVMVKLYN